MMTWSKEKKQQFRVLHSVKMPEQFQNHNYPHADCKEFFDFLFASDCSAFKGMVPIVSRKIGSSPSTIAMVPAEQVGDWVSLMHISEKTDYYFGKAQQPRPDCKWGKESAFAYNLISCDIDCHKRSPSISPKSVVDTICEMLPLDNNIPAPNAVVYTGRGFHLIWAIDQVAALLEWMVTEVSVAFSRAVGAILRDYGIADYGVDCSYARNVSGLTRLPGSRNTKSGIYSTCEIIHRKRLDLLRAFDSIPSRKTRPKFRISKCGNGNKYVRAAGMARILSLHKLHDIRGDIEVGSRDIFLFILHSCCIMAGMTDDEAVEHVLNTNRSFSKPMPSEEILRYLSTARRKGGYKYATATIIDTLGITPDEQQVIGLCASSETRNRNSARDQRTAAKRRDRDRQIMSLFLQGWSIGDIAATGIACYNTVKAVIRSCLSVTALFALFTVQELVHLLSVPNDSVAESFHNLPFQNLKTQIIMLITPEGINIPLNSELINGELLWST